MQYGWAFLALLWVAPCARAAGWDYSKTHFFGAGLTEWADPNVTTFEKESRQDTVLAETLVARGVPDRQVRLLVDDEASRARMLKGLRATLKASREGDSLIFYFAGHGVLDDATGKTHFMPYDAKVRDPRYRSYLSVDAVVDEIARKFRGENVLLLSDSCHAGAIVDAIRRQRGRIRFAAIASSGVHASSTPDWTFTGAIVEGLQGFAGADRNRDGTVTLKELGQYARHELAFTDYQNSHAGAKPKQMSSTTMVLSDLSGGKGHKWVGRHVNVEFQGRWYWAKVREAKSSRALVRWYMEDLSIQQDWVTWNRVKRYTPRHLARGTRVFVSEVPAVVLKSWYGLYKVRAVDDSHQPREFWTSEEAVSLPRG